MKILVVDDEQDICEILQYNLETEGYEVETANSAEEALTLPLTDYSLILLDVMMGEMSGFQMARKMKDNPETAGIPIIFITALDSEDNTVRGLNIGADDYIAKPLMMKEVKARVKAVLRRTASASKNNKEEGEEESNIIRYKGIMLNMDSKTAVVDGDEITLSSQAKQSVWTRRLAGEMLATRRICAGSHGRCQHHSTEKEDRRLRKTNQNSCWLWLLL